MTAQTQAERSKKARDKKIAAGLKQSNIWIKPEKEEQLKKVAEILNNEKM